MAVNLDNRAYPFELKGRVLTLTVLHLLTIDLIEVEEKLEKMSEQAPAFFKSLPLIIDVEEIAAVVNQLNFHKLYTILKKKGFLPIGVQGIEPEQVNGLVLGDLHVLPSALAVSSQTKHKASEHPDTEITTTSDIRTSHTRFVDRQVRSGQQIYAKGCDLIIAGSVSPGAEVLADGHIHIYGALRGRALAGVTGDTSARIFCREMDAELIAIAGQYRVNESFRKEERKLAAQIYLKDERLVISSL